MQATGRQSHAGQTALGGATPAVPRLSASALGNRQTLSGISASVLTAGLHAAVPAAKPGTYTGCRTRVGHMQDSESTADNWQQRLDALLERIAVDPVSELDRACTQLYEQARQTQRPDVAAALALHFGRKLVRGADFDLSVAWLDRALQGYRQLGDKVGELLASAYMAARLTVVAGHADAAARHLAHSLDLLTDTALAPGQRAFVNHALSNCYKSQGLTAAALRIVSQHLQVTEQASGPRSLQACAARVNLMNLLLACADEVRLHRPQVSEAHLQSALGLAQLVQDDLHLLKGEALLYALVMCGLVLSRSGQRDSAKALLRQALAQQQAHGSEFAKTARVELAVLLAQEGQHNEALHLAAEARTQLRRGEAELAALKVWEWQALARLALVNGEWREAHDCQALVAAHLREHMLAMLQARVSKLGLRISEESIRLQFESLRDVNEDLSHQATTDPLTGVPNRRALEAEFARRQQAGRAIVALIFDLDHFKTVNDRYSHRVGDDVLRRVCQVVRQTLRGSDLLGRYGGEEFVVLLAEPPDAGLPELAERLRLVVQNQDWEPLTPGFRVTISGGWAEVRAEDSFDAVVARADARLYEAKRAGRNRIIGGN
ncbi:MAG: diguanylate cyclase [Burkholderiaceae bacterium]|nr:diguanylate cyclase [Rhodoferax sp.]MCP5283436.1 diguanylate cyclase [Burkholderiaceae bacterium]